jgi:hypothetical protein
MMKIDGGGALKRCIDEGTLQGRDQISQRIINLNIIFYIEDARASRTLLDISDLWLIETLE